MLRMFKRKYKAMMMAWVMLLSFLPQVLVKGFHQHGTSLDKVECNFVARTLHAPSTSTAEDRNAQATQKQHDNQRKHLAQHQKNSSDEGRSDSTDGHDCAICHFLISPFTPPTFTAFSFYAPTVRVAYLQQAESVCSVAVATPQLRGPPQG